MWASQGSGGEDSGSAIPFIPSAASPSRADAMISGAIDVGFRPDVEIPLAVDLATEIAQDLAAAFDLEPARYRVLARENSRLRFG